MMGNREAWRRSVELAMSSSRLTPVNLPARDSGEERSACSAERREVVSGREDAIAN